MLEVVPPVRVLANQPMVELKVTVEVMDKMVAVLMVAVRMVVLWTPVLLLVELWVLVVMTMMVFLWLLW